MVQRRHLRFGIVGLGAFGEDYLTCLQGLGDALDLSVAAVCSTSLERAAKIAARFGVPQWYDDATSLAQDDGVDVVCVVTAESDHFQPTLAALQAGKHVIVEKPLATRLDDADALISAAEKTDRFLTVGHLLRFDLKYRLLAAQVREGCLGRIASMHTRRNRPAVAVARYRRTHPFLETGVLDLDVMLWLAQSRVTKVHAFTRTINPGPTPDLVWGVLEFESGALGLIETCWLAPNEGIFTDDALNVIGDKGTARIDLSRAPLSIWNEDGYQMPDSSYGPPIEGRIAGALAEELTYFVSCIRTNRPPDRVPIADVRHGLAVALQLVESSSDGRERRIETS